MGSAMQSGRGLLLTLRLTRP